MLNPSLLFVALAIAPSGSPAPVPPATDSTTASPSSTDPAPTPPQSWNRRGITLGIGGGIVGCATESCGRAQRGPRGQLELGYRVGWVAPMLGLAGGISQQPPAIESSGREEYVYMLDLNAGLMVFPVARGRLDPYVGAGLGYARARRDLTQPGSGLSKPAYRLTQTFSQAGVQLTGGLGIYLSETLAVGPRFQMTLPFAGRAFVHESGTDVPALEHSYDLRSAPEAERRRWPRWWSVMFSVTVVLPGSTGR